MAIEKCPGQDKRFWRLEDIFDIRCPECDSSVEFWRDDIRRRCPSCGHEFANPKLDLACAEWCQYAKECLAGLTLEDRLIIEMKKVFGDDERRIQRTMDVLCEEKKLLEERRADPAVVMASAILHDIDPPIAREILQRLGVANSLTNEICDIIAGHHAGGVGSEKGL